MSSSPRSTATTSRTAAPGISRRSIRAIRARSPGTTIEVLTPDFLRKDGALEVVVEAKPDVFNHNLETVPSKYLTVRPGRALLPLDPAAPAREGARSGDVHEVRHHGRARRGAERGAPADGRSALGRGRFPDRRPVPAADAQAPPGGPLRAAGRVQGLRDHRLRQGLPSRLGNAADPLLPSRRRRFRQAEERPRRRSSGADGKLHAVVPHHAAGAAHADADVRARRRRRALSGVPAALRGPAGAPPGRRAGRGWRASSPRCSVGYKTIHETFTTPGDPRPDAASHPRRVCRRPLQLPREPLEFPHRSGTAARSSSSSTTSSRASRSGS